MAIKSFLCSPCVSRLCATILVGMSGLGLSGCQLTARKLGPQSNVISFQQPAPGQPRPEAAIQPERPTPNEPKRVAVILGPGGAKTLAHVGVLKALQQQRIPIEKVVGLEWGSLIAALYAQKGQVHDLEWKLYKLDQQELLKPKKKGFFGQNQGPESVGIMDQFFTESFSGEDISRVKVGFACPSRSIWTGVVAWQNRGPLRDAVKRCLPFPPLFKLQGTFVAGASQAVEAVELLAKENFNVIIVVNVLGSAVPVAQDAMLDNLNQVILWQEVKRAVNEVSKLNVELIQVDTSAYPMVNFDAKKDLMALGEAAGAKVAAGLISKYGF